MPFLPMIILLFVVFFILIFALRYILTSNIRKATSHLDQMSQDYAIKESEIERRLKESKEEALKIVAEAKRDVDEIKSRALKDAQELKEGIIKEAHQKSDDMIAQTDKTCESLRREILDRIELRSSEKAFEMVQNGLADDFRQRLHALWMEDAEKTDFDLGCLKVPEQVKEIKLVSAFVLTEKQKRILNDKLTQRFGADLKISAEVDPSLAAGLVMTIGNVVIDGSLKNKILAQVQNKK